MKRYVILLLSLIFVFTSFSACKKVVVLEEQEFRPTDAVAVTEDSSEAPTVPVIVTEPEAAAAVDREIWDRCFSQEGLASLTESYTVTNVPAEGRWDTAVTPDRVSRLSYSDAEELRAGVILANGEGCVLQFTYSAETGWQQDIYGETATVEEYVAEITRQLVEELELLSGKFQEAVLDEATGGYRVEVEIPYAGPALVDPSQELPTVANFEVFFTDGEVTKINKIDGEALSVIHSFGCTPIPQLPEL
ncbi:MAG: hypothetical protein IKT58_03605 [Oscillospiraceae bacterium]|nr:hypothetical protein [Oscillospiraceae bacterium]